jgi:hypothetical protein
MAYQSAGKPIGDMPKRKIPVRTIYNSFSRNHRSSASSRGRSGRLRDVRENLFRRDVGEM